MSSCDALMPGHIQGVALSIGMGNGLNLGEVVPDFTAETSSGNLVWHEYISNKWAILFSHPGDFTPVCTTELGELGRLRQEFHHRQIKLAALSCNEVACHKAWIADIEAYTPGSKVDYPIIADPDRHVAALYGMLDPDERNHINPNDPLPMTARAVFIVGPDKKLKLSFLYPATTGRSFKEILRIVDSLQLTATHSVATPVNWQPGEAVMVRPNLSQEEATAKFPQGFAVQPVPSGKDYLRLTPQPDK